MSNSIVRQNPILATTFRDLEVGDLFQYPNASRGIVYIKSNHYEAVHLGIGISYPISGAAQVTRLAKGQRVTLEVL